MAGGSPPATSQPAAVAASGTPTREPEDVRDVAVTREPSSGLVGPVLFRLALLHMRERDLARNDRVIAGDSVISC
jgi:hypothetical protein